MLTSPWTMNLCTLLKSVMEDNGQEDRFAVVLKERLRIRGAELLDEVGVKSSVFVLARVES